MPIISICVILKQVQNDTTTTNVFMTRKNPGEIVKIGNLFDKYKKTLKAPQGVVIDAFIEVIDDLMGFEIKKEQCRYTVSTKTLGVAVSGPLKSEITIRKKEILAHLKGRLGEKSAPKDIV